MRFKVHDPATNFAKQVLRTLHAALKPNYKERLYTYFVDSLCEFLRAVNPDFPKDSVSVLDMALCCHKMRSLPAAEEISILKRCFKDAFDVSGTLRWKFIWPVLSIEFGPKHCGSYRTVRFRPVGDTQQSGPLSFPLEITVDVYADMNARENHSELCPVHYPEHSYDCPVSKLMRSKRRNITEKDWKKADNNCYCSADDCNCEGGVIKTTTRVFKESEAEKFDVRYTKWLAKAIAYPEET